jgi:hypothetical protein
MRLTEICLSLMLIPFFTPAAFDGWKGIVPLRSTRSEVEYQLGKPVATCEYTCTYETPNERVSIVYSTDPCGLGDQNRWRVMTGTVVTVIVYPTEKPRLKDLRLNLRRFSKTKNPELAGYWVYTNEREGISYEVSNTGRVLSVEWFPASKDNSLNCKQ